MKCIECGKGIPIWRYLTYVRWFPIQCKFCGIKMMRSFDLQLFLMSLAVGFSFVLIGYVLGLFAETDLVVKIVAVVGYLAILGWVDLKTLNLIKYSKTFSAAKKVMAIGLLVIVLLGIYFAWEICLRATGKTPDQRFSKFLSIESPVAQLYQHVLTAGLIEGLERKIEPDCKKVLEIQSVSAEISVIKLYCAITTGDSTMIFQLAHDLSLWDHIWFLDDDFDREYILSSIDYKSTPSNIIGIIGVSSSRPIIDLLDISNAIRSALKAGKLTPQQVRIIGEKFEKGSEKANKFGSNGYIIGLIGMNLQITSYKKCLSEAKCNLNDEKVRKRRERFKIEIREKGKDEFDTDTVFYFPITSSVLAYQIQYALMTRNKDSKREFEKRVMGTYLGRYYGELLNWK